MRGPYRESGKPIIEPEKPQHTIESLMKLIAVLNGHGDQYSHVTIGYMRARVFTAQDESHLDDEEWGFTVSTTILGEKDYNGKPVTPAAQGRDLIAALQALAREVVRILQHNDNRRKDRLATAKQAFAEAKLDPY